MQRKHWNNFNLIRLLAAAQVLVVHALNHLGFEGEWTPALKAVPGVPTFFFISGLLIYTSYERTREQGLGAFFNNRLLRIYPALWTCVVLSVLAVAATGYFATATFSVGDFVLWLFSQTSIFQFYNPDFMRAFGVGVLNGALWTISVELQFYLLTPILFWLLTRHRAMLAALVVLSLLANVAQRLNPDADHIAAKLLYVSFIPWVYMFLLGFIVAHMPGLISRAQQQLRLRWLVPAYLVSQVAIGPYETNASNAINPLSFILLAGCILRLSTMPLPLPPGATRFIARQDFSYGLYLYHMPVLNLLIFLGWFSAVGNLVAVAVLSALLAAMSWYLVEKPVLRHKR